MSAHPAHPRLTAPGLRGDSAMRFVLGAAVVGVSAAGAVALGPLAVAIPLLLGIIALLVRFPPALLVVYVYVGIFKGERVLSDLPFDVTAALGALIVLVCIHRFLGGRVRSFPGGYVVLLLLIGVMLAISLAWTPMPEYGLEKVLKFWTLTLVAALSPFFLLEDRRDLRRLLLAIVAFAAIAAVVAIADPGSPSAGRIEFGGNENTIFTSRLLCAGALVLLFAPQLGVPRRLRFVAPLLGLGLVVVAAGIGSRGPLVALAFALAAVVIASVVRSPGQLGWVLVIVVAGLAVLPFVQLPETSQQRLERAVNDPTGTLEQDGRSRLYGKAIELASDNPLRGFGSGGFFLYSYVLMDQEEKYPHNMFLELAAEVGLGPAIALAAAVFVVLVGLGRRAWTARVERDRRLVLVVGGLFLLCLFEVQFSGDINENRVFWLMLGTTWLLVRHGLPDANRQEAAGSP